MSTLPRYWVVSPNVNFNPSTVAQWREASVKWSAAFIGWGNDHSLGRKFAYDINPGDVILIARRSNWQPEVVGFGIVKGKFKKRLTGLRTPHSFGSLRELSPFIALSKQPKVLPLADAVNQTAALHELHPKRNENHRRICDWMDAKLSLAATANQQSSQRASETLKLAPLPSDNELEYQVRTRSEVKQARKKEAELVSRYRDWLAQQDRQLKTFKKAKVRCDAYEAERNNLIEAKCSIQREYIRMAVGQLLDYAFSVRGEFGNCNKAILLPNKPGDELIEWLEPLGINVVWEEHSKFLDNANGQFM